jgi:hypothetical protein
MKIHLLKIQLEAVFVYVLMEVLEILILAYASQLVLVTNMQTIVLICVWLYVLNIHRIMQILQLMNVLAFVLLHIFLIKIIERVYKLVPVL